MMVNGSNHSTQSNGTASKPKSITTTESPLTPSPMNNAISFDRKTPLRAISKPYFPHLHQSERINIGQMPQPQQLQQPQLHPQPQQPQVVNVNLGHQTMLPSTSMLHSVPNVQPSASMIPSMPNLATSTMLQSIPNGSMLQSVPNGPSMLQSVPNSTNSFQIQQSVGVQQNIMIPQLIQIQPALYGMQPNLYGIYNIIQPNDQQQRQYQAAATPQQESNADDESKHGVQCPPVSMLSVAGVRYHGQLYTVDVDEQSIALKHGLR